ncbi:MAG TPA: tripartite tricarboxylate transporter substrate binding protein BugE [Casimicrobiaceae bacterium]|jgi:tripartite-type tricarboxylate transporter receptor subunit TctC|nr:tripartite tricarboxylate transporter substrate binding protein BugE [Casimicrobiaceae bacterium]
MRRRTFLASAGALAVVAFDFAWADTYPSRPIRMIVPFAPGGSTDVVARVISEPMMRQLGQPVVVDNKGGAGGIIGTMEVVRAAPDGYTIVMASPSVTAASPAINPNAGYNPLTDLTPIINVAASPTILAVHPSFPAKNFQEFIAELKRKPDRYSYATPGVGGIIHLQMEAFKALTGTSIKHIPFRGAGPALVAVVGGQVDIIQDSMPSCYPFVKEGKLVPIAITAPARRKELPNTPTLKEVGLPELNYMGHFGLLGPKGLPKDVVEKLNAATRKAVEEPAIRQKIEDSGAVVVASSPAEFAAEINAIYTQLKKVVADRKLTID